MSKQLQLVLELEQRKEDKTLIDFRQAKDEYDKQLARLQGLFRYRQDYLRSINERGQEGIAINTFGHLHSFVSTLDGAEERQQHQVGQAKAVMSQRQERWLKQRQRKMAIEKLIENKAKQAVIAANRQEQRDMDERALVQFIKQNQVQY